jgi:hypothetical protein
MLGTADEIELTVVPDRHIADHANDWQDWFNPILGIS